MRSTDDSDRIDALEAHSAHQDRVLTELSDAVAEQWKRIDALTREVLRLRDEVQGLSRGAAIEKPPPHY
jgi:SlyX protein